MEKVKALAPRCDFPAVENHAYLDAASIGLMPTPVRETVEEFSRKIFEAGTVSFDEEAETLALEESRMAAANLINAEPSNVAIIHSATEGLCQLAWGIRPRGNVVSIDIEHPTVVYPWKRVVKDTGASLRLVHVMDDPGKLSLKDVETVIDKNTEVVCVSHAQYSNGFRFDLKKLAELAHEYDALCIIDATQSAGIVPIDVTSSGVDALVAGGYKWLCGPFGAAFMYISPQLQERIEPVFVGWRSTDNPFYFDATKFNYAPSLRRYEYSTMNYASGFGLGKAISYIERFGIHRVLEHALKLSDRLIKGLDELKAEVLTPRDYSRRTGTVMARFPGRDGEKVAAELNKRGVIVSPRFGGTRFSPHLYNNSDDIDRALEVLSSILNK